MNKIKILFLSANPILTPHLHLDEEVRTITERIRATEFRDTLELFSAWAVQPRDILLLLNIHKPHIVHFSGHGSKDGNLLFADSDKGGAFVSVRTLKTVFTVLKDNIRLVVFNACYTQPQAIAISKTIDCVIGTNQAIGDQAAIVFAASLYQAIGFGCSIRNAYDQGKAALLLEGFEEEKAPRLYVKKNLDASQINLLQKSKAEDISFEQVRQVLALCSRRAIFADQHSELSVKAMFDSLKQCRIALQKIVVFVTPETMQRLVVGIINELDHIERIEKNSLIHFFDEVDESKSSIIKILIELTKAAGIPYTLPATLITDYGDDPWVDGLLPSGYCRKTDQMLFE
ncbi:CHAT domain-containing protein [Dictyobacter formicarum]|uniref:CHAT domain-containing protein n=1 Tax=Dictyobacter formicarum TaxID=2778368 RepID=A0ABQ3VQS5_9CHLR|nr:CHAT domain-containing protein [Dictyobacter formicarum]GHO88056.1 hypothetical protein KSZ_60620 [Dictyobacter formicarum]